MDALTSIDQNLDAHVRYVHESALVPSAWVEACRYYGLTINGRSAGPATVEEVAEALRAITVRAAGELERAQSALPPGTTDERAERLWDRLAGLIPKEAEAYRVKITPKTNNLGLGAIFENAQASVGKHWWSDMKYDLRVTLICKTCGAPQQKSREFQCVYCGGDLFRRGAPAGT